MPEISVSLDASTECFYRRVADAAGLTLGQLAGELALEALSRQSRGVS